jgi:hypothetical protein
MSDRKESSPFFFPLLPYHTPTPFNHPSLLPLPNTPPPSLTLTAKVERREGGVEAQCLSAVSARPPLLGRHTFRVESLDQVEPAPSQCAHARPTWTGKSGALVCSVHSKSPKGDVPGRLFTGTLQKSSRGSRAECH